MKRYQVLVLIVIIFCIGRIYTKDYLKESKIRVIDHHYQSDKGEKLGILFRTNCPLTSSGVFDYENLFAKLSTVAARDRHISLTNKNSKMIIYNVIGDDEDVLNKEKEFFSKNLSKGEVRHFPIRGEIINPDAVSPAALEEKSKRLDWMQDDLEGIVDSIRRTLISPTTPSINNVIIIIHCRRGKDRTGEVSGAYQLKYGHKSFEVMTALNYEIYNENIVFWQERALVWFCYNLKNAQNYAHLNCSHANLYIDSKPIPKLLGWNASLYYEFSDLTFFTFLSTLFLSILLNFILYYYYFGRRILPHYLPLIRSYLFRSRK